HKALVLVTGEHGLGKSLVIRAALAKLGKNAGSVGLLGYPVHDRVDFLRQINHSFGLDSSSISKHELLESLRKHLSDVDRAGGRSTLFIDNVDTLSSA